ncbi:MAG: hypothetical protein AAF438_22485, partial [Pseudomonadota bacterium]
MNKLSSLSRLAAAVSLALVGATVASAEQNGWDKHRTTGWAKATKVYRTDHTQVPGGCPIESPTGKFLFTARNPGSGLDIFVNQQAPNSKLFEFGDPLPAPVNDAGLANDFCPTPRPDGQLYFVSNRSGGCGSADMHVAINNPATGWDEPVNLGCEPHGPNTPGLELSPSILETRWGTFLLYSTDYHTGNQDIYVSRMRKDGTFRPGKRL